MQVLVQLASHPHEVLSKDQLISTVWADTFVGDDVLTRSISEIRRVFDDDARAPKFIQTIPKTGYRLLVPVSFDSAAPAIAPVESPSNGTAKPAIPEAPLQPERPKFNFWPLALLVLVIAVGGAWWLATQSKSPAARPQEFKTVPLTSYLGTETQPSFSPDGNQVAFVWKDENSDRQHV